MATGGLDVLGLSVTYGAIKAVCGVSLRVEEGETVALLGANGAGKSSTLNAVAGLVPASGGEVRLNGKRIDGLDPEQVVRRGIALAPEGRRVFATLTVGENLRLGGSVVPDKVRRDELEDRVLGLFPKLSERFGQGAGSLSGGEQQMLAIGRALMADPNVLLLDEPSLGLAPIVVDQIFELIGRMKNAGTTMLLVEQEVRRALEVADRAYVLVHGQVRAQGSATELLANTNLEALYLGPVGSA